MILPQALPSASRPSRASWSATSRCGGAEVRNRCATFAVVIGPEHQSRGLGTEATSLMMNYGFTELGLHRIELMVNADNSRGIAAYQRAGFEQEGLLRSKLFYGGQFHDQILMAALSHIG